MSAVPLSSNWASLKTKSKSEAPSSHTLKKKPNVVVKVIGESRPEEYKPKEKKRSTTLQIFEREARENTQTANVSGATITHTATTLSSALARNNITPALFEDGSFLSQEAVPLDEKKRSTGKFLGIDCEFVGVGPDGTESALARVSVVNFFGHVILDEYVKPKEKVTDWRTWVSGISPKHMNGAISFEKAQKLCSDLFANRILVGHAIHHDLGALMLSHPASLIRDTSKHLPFKQLAKGKTPGLKRLTQHFLKIEIQSGEHSSVEDARATILLYRMFKKEFEMAQRQKMGYQGQNRKFKTGGKSARI